MGQVSMVRLARDIATPVGFYPAGLRVFVRDMSDTTWRLCLDPGGVHLGNRCHSVTVSRVDRA